MTETCQRHRVLLHESIVDVRRLSIVAGVVLPLVLLAECGTPKTTAIPTTIVPPSGSRTTVPLTTGPTTTTMPPKISGFLAQSASFVTADDGFVMGIVGCPKGVCLALRHTVDRGTRWTSVTPPQTTLGQANTGGVSELHFADSLNGWAFGGTLWVTHDGAQHWHQVNLGGDVVGMASGAGEAYALVGPCASSSACSGSGHLYRSAVGGDSWTEVAGASGRFDQGQFSLVVEGRTVFVLAAFPRPEILSSSDGIHFASLPVPCSPSPTNQPVPFLPGGLAASDPGNVAVACLGGVGAGSQLKQVFVSDDGGHTYQRLPDSPMEGDGVELAMPAPTTLLLGTASAATSVFRIAPPDNVWATPLFFGDGGARVSDLAFVDPAHGALVHGRATIALSILGLPNPPSGLGELYLTDNGGSTWYPEHIPS